MEKVNIHLILLGAQFNMSAIEKFSKYDSSLFHIHEISSIYGLPATDLPNWTYSKQLIKQLFENDKNTDITLAIIENKIEGNYFLRRLSDNSMVVTFYEAKEILRDANIDLFNYLLLETYKIVTLYRIAGKKIAENSWEFIHDETRGCLFDMTGIKYDIVHSASNAHLCQQCEANLVQQNLPSSFVSTLKKELKKIRKSNYNIIVEFVKQNPILSLIITAISSVFLSVLSSYLFEWFKK